MFYPYHRKRGGTKRQRPACFGAQSQPTASESTKAVRVTEQRNPLTRPLSEFVEQRLESLPDACRVFAARTAITEEKPFGPLLLDLGGGETLVLTVVPFAKPFVDLGLQSRQFSCLDCPAGRAREHQVEVDPCEAGGQVASLFSPLVGQRYIGRSGVATAQGPLGLSVSRQPDLG